MTKKQLKKELAEAKIALSVANLEIAVAERRNARYRRMIERASGKKFVFGYDPTDRSMIEGDERTYGWFIPAEPVSYGVKVGA